MSERAGLELTVERQGAAGDPAIEEPVLEIELPAAAHLDARALEGLRAHPAIRDVLEPDGRGWLRIHLRQEVELTFSA